MSPSTYNASITSLSRGTSYLFKLTALSDIGSGNTVESIPVTSSILYATVPDKPSSSVHK